MRKLISVILCLVFVFSFVACGKNADDNASSSTVVDDKSAEVEAAVVTNGSIPELKFALGDSVYDLDAYYKNLVKEQEQAHENTEGHVHEEGDILLNISEGVLSATYEIGSAKYYYEKAKAKSGIAVVCSLGDAYGFKQGSSKQDIEAALSGLEIKSLNAGEDELYFVPLSEAIILRYKKGNKQLDFYFYSNELVATVLRNTETWTI